MLIIKKLILERAKSSTQTFYLPKNSTVVAVREAAVGIELFYLTGAHEQETSLRNFKVLETDCGCWSKVINYIGFIETPLGLRHILEVE